MKNKRTPDIRFPGFTGDWEQYNLGNVSTKIGSGKTPKGGNQNYKSEGIPLLRSQNIFNNKVNFNDVVYITPEIDEDMANSRVQKGDVLLNITGASIGRSAVYKLNHKANVNQHVSIIRPSGEVNPYFIQLNITSEKGQKQIELNQAGGGREGLNFQQIAKMGFYFPDLLEQGEIGDFFIKLDNTIAFYQQELTTLKQTKQGFLQKMFPKEGEPVPEIRFPGFTGEWEQYKLEELAEIVRGASPRPIQDPKWFDKNSEIGWLRIADVTEQDGRIHQLKQKISKAGQAKTRVLTEPHLLLSIAATVGKPVVNYVKTGVHDGFLIFMNPKFDMEFMFQWLEMFRPKWQKYGQPGSQVNLNSDLVKSHEILIPSKEEQKTIGNFFKQLDDTIALHQRELDALNQTKKAFLQKMFA
ncbi:restriction endonuclease subunit S [Bacillus wiedmannii]